jgi:exopolyphosphatase/guanosine-5'-triphosphate,3'-diphosphate pyrophosphatase
VVAELRPGDAPLVLEEASRSVLLGRDTFSTGRISAGTIEAALRALDGFRSLMDGYGVGAYRAVATSAVREAANADTFIDRVRVRTGLDVEIIDGSEESRLTFLAVQSVLRGHAAMESAPALLVEVGGGSADVTLVEGGRPKYSGVFALGSIRLRQSLGPWHGAHDQRVRLLSRHIANIVTDIRRDVPMKPAQFLVALGGEMRFVASQVAETEQDGVRELSREAFLAFVERLEKLDEDELVERFRLSEMDAETLVPTLLVYRSLLLETSASVVIVPEASLRSGLLIDLVGQSAESTFENFARQVLASAEALGEKYRYDAAHARNVAHLAARLFDELQTEHGLRRRDRLMLEVAALLHDIGTFVGLRAHHKHAQYLLAASEIFGLSRDDVAVVSNIARYHRRGLPQKSHLPYTALDRDDRVRVNKLGALLRVANALDAEHLQKVRDLRVKMEGERWVLELDATGDLTMERLATTARADLFADVFGRTLTFGGSVHTP